MELQHTQPFIKSVLSCCSDAWWESFLVKMKKISCETNLSHEAYGEEICLFEWHKMLSEVTEHIKNNGHPGYLVTMRSRKNVRTAVTNRRFFRHQNDGSGGERGKWMARQISTTNLRKKKHEQKCRKKWSQGMWVNICQFLPKEQIPMFKNSLYSQALAPALCGSDFYKNWKLCSKGPIFSQLKKSL